MERVETLCNLLMEKLQNKASADEMLSTVRMLESELVHLKNITPREERAANNAAVKVSKLFQKETGNSIPAEDTVPEEKTTEVLQIDEADIEAELEEIKKIAEQRNTISMHSKPPLTFDPIDDIPTLAGRKSVENEPSLSTPQKEIHELLQVNNNITPNEPFRKPEPEPELPEGAPVKDLKKAISAGERQDYIDELFRGDEAMYERSIKTINSFAIYAEAEFWIRRELKLKLAWADKNDAVRRFDQLVRRRFA